jgi:hypothetical protein
VRSTVLRHDRLRQKKKSGSTTLVVAARHVCMCGVWAFGPPLLRTDGPQVHRVLSPQQDTRLMSWCETKDMDIWMDSLGSCGHGRTCDTSHQPHACSHTPESTRPASPHNLAILSSCAESSEDVHWASQHARARTRTHTNLFFIKTKEERLKKKEQAKSIFYGCKSEKVELPLLHYLNIATHILFSYQKSASYHLDSYNLERVPTIQWQSFLIKYRSP